MKISITTNNLDKFYDEIKSQDHLSRFQVRTSYPWYEFLCDKLRTQSINTKVRTYLFSDDVLNILYVDSFPDAKNIAAFIAALEIPCDLVLLDQHGRCVIWNTFKCMQYENTSNDWIIDIE